MGAFFSYLPVFASKSCTSLYSIGIIFCNVDGGFYILIRLIRNVGDSIVKVFIDKLVDILAASLGFLGCYQRICLLYTSDAADE